jgi:hypothetical protein
MKPTNPLRADEGNTIDIRWEYWSEKPLISASWKKYDENGNVKALIAEKHGQDDVKVSVDYKGKAKIFDKVSLRLENVKPYDAGWYGCELKFNGVSDMLKNITQLLVEGEYRPNAKVQVMICRYTISLPCVLKTKDRLDNTIVLCMIVRLIVYSAYNYSPFQFGL